MMRTRAIQTTKWGTACAQCAAAKAKCSGRPGNQGSKCDRCERLLKQCTDQAHRPRKVRQSRQSQQTDTGSPNFDGMLESLVSTPEHPSSPAAADLGLDTSSVRSHLSGPLDRPSLFRSSSSHSQQNVDGAPEPYGANSFYAPTPSVGRDMIFDVREDMDQVLFSKYCAEFMPQHPFVIIPRHISAVALKLHHPLLMLAITVVASFEDLQTMHARMHHVTNCIADRMFRQAERSLDLLMGIVVILGWHHYHCVRHSQLNNLLCLAESLVSDLGLNKRSPVGHGGVEDGRAIEEKRLLLGVWYLRSSVAMHLHQLTSMPFTLYMRQCLVDIAEAKEHSLDQVVVHFVKTQYLAERVAVLKTPLQGSTDLSSEKVALDRNDEDRGAQERGAALAGCQGYLDRLVRELPGSLKDDAMIATQFNTVALRLSEPRGSDMAHSHGTDVSMNEAASFSANAPTIETLLQGANIRARDWFQSWISRVPVSRYRSLPSHAILQLLYAAGAVLCRPVLEPSVSGAVSAPETSSSVSSGHPQLNSPDDPTPVLNRLIALGATRFDMDRFWTALGERHDDKCRQAGSGGEDHLIDGLNEAGEDLLGAVMSAGIQGRPRREGPSSAHTLGDAYRPLLESQASQSMYHANMFVPPSRVPSAGPGPISEPVLSATPQILQPQPSQWAGVLPWDSGSSSWATPEGMDPQAWLRETGQGNPPYGWGVDRRY
ncbi:hypothetical protein BT67DRAFT_55004 [Trichocladium antarcticum]|uniref:Zn(2)-C6 fungal-type domain-containing protein n=1 Tax=Trichocladium antarcticum TaxID=1450529 RepID=A0AAN6UJ65_9PEZI|nr:hypothetical protein BT67DRAFT_55004 [Trichocladium antarcticum]